MRARLDVVGAELLPRATRAPSVALAKRVQGALLLPDDTHVSLTFVDDDEMRALNRQWRGKDKTTDVLSFSSWEGEPLPGADDVVGDLVVSFEQAARQARALGHGLDVEIAVLVAHGLLHLVGLDHERSLDEARLQASCEMTLLSHAGVDPCRALIGRALVA